MQAKADAKKRDRSGKNSVEDEEWFQYLLSDEDARKPKHARKAKDIFRKAEAKIAQKIKTGMQCQAVRIYVLCDVGDKE